MVGTSGWTYTGWYPRGLAERERLPWYARHFEGVEVDSSFYALPGRRTTDHWAAVTPPAFTFDVKLHRLLSRHAAPPSALPADLRRRASVTPRGRVVLDAELERALCERTLVAVEPLRRAGKLSSLLLQLTPAFKPPAHHLGELERILELLAPVPVAVELRHRAWLRDVEAMLDWFRVAGAAFVCVDVPAVDAPHVPPRLDAATRDDLAYLRVHGRNAGAYLRGRTAAERYEWRYSDAEIAQIVTRARALARDSATVRLMFGNGVHAPSSAQRARDVIAAGPAAA